MQKELSNVDRLLKARAEIDDELRRHKSQLTILFTDIVGSTSYFDRYGDTAGFAMVQRHAGIATSTFSEYQGTIIKMIGDSVMAEFPEPALAVRGSVELQRRLAEQNKRVEERDRILLRIGINAGRGFRHDNDVYGDAVNMAARICKKTGPAQILISRSVRDAILQERDLRCTWLGKVTLSGKTDPEDIFEVIWTDSAAYTELRQNATAAFVRGDLVSPGLSPEELLVPKRATTPLLVTPPPAAVPAAPSTETGGAAPDSRYELLEELGRGGMGLVYKARDRDTGELVALKVLKPEIASEPTVFERFKNELRIARRITHKNVCRIYDLHRTGNTVCIAMEFVEGDSLRQVLERNGKLDIIQGLRVIRQITSGLREAHEQGVVHRDLKPENVMLDRTGNVKLMDFGIARTQGAGLTFTGGIIGTPAYMSPEQAEGKQVDARTDIYALGLVMYEVFTGQTAFHGDTPIAIALKQIRETPPTPRTHLPELPEFIERAIMKCLEKDAGQRFQTLEELDAALVEPRENVEPRERIEPRQKAAPIAAGAAATPSETAAARGAEAGVAPAVAPPVVHASIAATATPPGALVNEEIMAEAAAPAAPAATPPEASPPKPPIAPAAAKPEAEGPPAAAGEKRPTPAAAPRPAGKKAEPPPAAHKPPPRPAAAVVARPAAPIPRVGLTAKLERQPVSARWVMIGAGALLAVLILAAVAIWRGPGGQEQPAEIAAGEAPVTQPQAEETAAAESVEPPAAEPETEVAAAQPAPAAARPEAAPARREARPAATPPPAAARETGPRGPVRLPAGQLRLLQSPAPAYPDAARRAGTAGNVELEIKVGEKGTVEEVRVLSGHPELASAARAAVEKWRYQPHLVGGSPVPVITSVRVPFELSPQELNLAAALANAESALAAGRLLAPPTDNALHWAAEALRLDSANPRARLVQQRALQAALSQLEVERRQRNYQGALTMLAQLGRYFPDRHDIQVLEQSIRKEMGQGRASAPPTSSALAAGVTQRYEFTHRHPSLTAKDWVAENYFCSGVLTVLPSGAARFDCGSTQDPQKRCHNVELVPGAITQVTFNRDGSLRVSTRGQGQWDFYGQRTELQSAYAALTRGAR